MIETPRLRLRLPRPDDASDIVALMTAPVAQWLASWHAGMTVAEVGIRIADALAEQAAGAALHFVIERRADRGVLGWIKVSRTGRDPRRGDLGYWLGEPFHGSGYMTEAAAALIRYSFAQLDLDVIEAGAQNTNEASFAVMRGLGMRFAGDRIVFSTARIRDEPCRFYEIGREQATA